MSKQVKWATGTDGLLTTPLVHDSALGAVSYRSSTLMVEIGEANRRTVFQLDGVQEANLCVWSNSIVSEIIIWRVGNLLEAGREAFDEAWPPLFDRQLFEHDIEKAAHRITTRNPDLLLFLLLCSYGGTMACIADAITVFQD